MDNLDGIREEIEEYCKGKIDIFNIKDRDGDIPSFKFDGGYIDFLNFAEKQGIKIINFFQLKVAENDSENKDNLGKIFLIEMGFMFQGQYYFFRKLADWYKVREPLKKVTKNDVKEEDLREFIEKTEKELVFILNKADMCKDVRQVVSEVRGLFKGVPVYALSALNNQGIEQLPPPLKAGKRSFS